MLLSAYDVGRTLTGALANLVFSCLLIYNSAPESMPFLFPSHLEETAALHVKFLVNYLGSLRNAKKDR